MAILTSPAVIEALGIIAMNKVVIRASSNGMERDKESVAVIGLLIFIIPILGIILYVNTVKLLKNIKEGKNTAQQTGWGAILTGLIIFLSFVLIISFH